MIRPIITNEAFSLRSYGGIINYFLRLLPELSEAGAAPTIAAPLRRGSSLDSSEFLLSPSLKLPEAARYVNRIANAAGLARESIEMLKHRNDEVVLHSSYFYRPVRKKYPTIVSVYDLIAELLPGEGDASPQLVASRERAIADADHIIAISETTRTDVVGHFGVDPAKVTVTHLAPGLRLTTPIGTVDRTRDPLVLYVGKRGGYKNFVGLLDAVGDRRTHRSLTIAAYGGGPFDDAEQADIQARGLGDRVHHVPADDSVLNELYRRALAFVCPSRYEGFGLPVLEAMERGCPVVIADAGALPEVAGSAALRYSPDHPEQLASHLTELLERPELRVQLASAGLERAATFSWSRTAEGTIGAYRSALDA